jgi:acyl-CoA thioester hydrolase
VAKVPLKLEIRIDWSDIDLLGHVNNLAILRYVQAARIQLLETIGLMQNETGIKIGPILASLSCQFRKPLFYPGEVQVHSSVDQINNSSFRIHHTVFDCSDEKVAAEAHDIIVVFDFDTQHKVTIPQELRARIEKVARCVVT